MHPTSEVAASDGVLAESGTATPPVFNRFTWLVILLAVEWIPISSWKTGHGARPVFIWAVAFASVFLAFGYLKNPGKAQRILKDLERIPLVRGYLAAHICLMLLFLGIEVFFLTSQASQLESVLLESIWFLAAAAAIVTAGFAFVPPRFWADFSSGTGSLWAVAAIGGVAAEWLFRLSQLSWNASPLTLFTVLTFRLVETLLRTFLSGVTVDPAIRTIGTHNFQVVVQEGCSGIEGAGLMLVFSVAWLWFFRRECRFPQALVLIPGAVLISWLLNVVRITALLLIGNAGAPNIAVGGFHSQAGWIAFNAVALAFSVIAGRVSWWSATNSHEQRRALFDQNPTAPYLVPFLAILAAGMISRAASSNFEWLYPLRFIGAAGALWFFRKNYLALDWRVSWFAPLIGGIVFAVWLLLTPAGGPHSDNGIPAGLASLPTVGKAVWLAFRVLAAVITVPIAEELAFRGFLIRRLISGDFTSLGARRFTVFSLAVSSIAFGLLHGGEWLAGTIAGLLFAAALLRRGRIGDAIAAHAVANALIAAAVLIWSKWYLW